MRPGSVKDRSRRGSLPVAVEVEQLEEEAVALEVHRRHPDGRRHAEQLRGGGVGHLEIPLVREAQDLLVEAPGDGQVGDAMAQVVEDGHRGDPTNVGVSQREGDSMSTTTSDLFLPEPEPREVLATIISVDDHLVEPADMFEGRLPASLQDRAPRIVVDERGHEVWEFDGQRHSQVGMNAVVGRRPETVQVEPFRFDQMRKGCWDIDARVHDMDLNGVWASLSFPSMITGFCGRVYSQCSDPELGLATTRAFNDWVHDAWWQPHPDRVIPLGITWLSDPELGAAEIRRNAERGFRAVTLPERPHLIGYPSIFDEYWEPILRACAETDTVVCLHVGSSGLGDFPPGCDRAIMPLAATLFGQLSLQACTEWLWSGWTVRCRS